MVPPGETTDVDAVWVKERSADCAAAGAGARSKQLVAARTNTLNERELRTRSDTVARIRCMARRALALQKLKRESWVICFPLESLSEYLTRPKMSFRSLAVFVLPASPRVSR